MVPFRKYCHIFVTCKSHASNVHRRFTPSGGGRSRRVGGGGRSTRGGDGGGRSSKSSSRAQSEEISLNSSSDHSDTEGPNQLVSRSMYELRLVHVLC